MSQVSEVEVRNEKPQAKDATLTQGKILIGNSKNTTDAKSREMNAVCQFCGETLVCDSLYVGGHGYRLAVFCPNDECRTKS
jgi:hypothetical protein